MYVDDLTHKGKPQPDTAQRAPAGFVKAGKRLKHTFFQLLRYAGAGICNRQTDVLVLHGNTNGDSAARRVVFYGVLHKVVNKAIQQNIAACYGHGIALCGKMDRFLLRKRFKVRQDLLNKGIQGNLVIPCHGLQFAHIQQGLDHLAQALVLLGHHTDGLLRTGIVGWMLGRVVQIQLQLHHGQWDAEFMRCIRRELLLCFKRPGQTCQHPVVGNTQPIQLGNAAFLNAGVRQVLCLHLLDSVRKFAERLQGASAYKIGGNAAGKRHQR